MGVGEKGESTLFERKGKKDPSIRSKTETHFWPMWNLQILSQNLFNHCMGDAPASLRAIAAFIAAIIIKDAWTCIKSQ